MTDKKIVKIKYYDNLEFLLLFSTFSTTSPSLMSGSPGDSAASSGRKREWMYKGMNQQQVMDKIADLSQVSQRFESTRIELLRLARSCSLTTIESQFMDFLFENLAKLRELQEVMGISDTQNISPSRSLISSEAAALSTQAAVTPPTIANAFSLVPNASPSSPAISSTSAKLRGKHTALHK